MDTKKRYEESRYIRSEFFHLAEDVKNPKPDRRKKNDLTAQPIWPKGMKVEMRVYYFKRVSPSMSVEGEEVTYHPIGQNFNWLPQHIVSSRRSMLDYSKDRSIPLKDRLYTFQNDCALEPYLISDEGAKGLNEYRDVVISVNQAATETGTQP